MSTQPNLPSSGGRDRGWFATFITTLPGILTASAAVITAIGGAFYGGTQVGQHAAAATPTVTVTVATTPSPVPSDSASSTPTGSSGGQSGGAGPAPVTGQAFLASLQALSPSNTGNINTGPVQLQSAQYQNSLRFSCSSGLTSVSYEVDRYGFLDATLGIPSDAQNTAGNTATFSFFKDGSTQELGSPIPVTVGSSRRIRLPLQGSTQLEITCKATSQVDIALGTATLLPS